MIQNILQFLTLCSYCGFTLSQSIIPSEKEQILTLIMDSLLLKYDSRIRPYYGTLPVEIIISMYFKNIPKVSEIDMEFKTDLYFRQQWTDPRLAYFHNPAVANVSHEKIPTTVRIDHAKLIWNPDTYFPLEKSVYVHGGTVPNEYVTVNGDGVVSKSTRLTLSTTCHMSLKYFPFDSQLCSIIISSYGHSREDLIFSWSEAQESQHTANVACNAGLGLPSSADFTAVGFRLQNLSQSISGRNYTHLSCDIQFTRSMGYYLIQIYLPSAVLVAVSWLSLWMDIDSISDRISMCITTILTITMIFSNFNSLSPKIAYVKAIDVYSGLCFIFIFISLLENSIVGYLYQKLKNEVFPFKNIKVDKTEKQLPDNNVDITWPLKKFKDGKLKFRLDTMNSVVAVTDKEELKVKKRCWEQATNNECQDKDLISNQNPIMIQWPSYIDSAARIIFPLSFFILNLIYWCYYLHVSKMETPNLINWNKCY